LLNAHAPGDASLGTISQNLIVFNSLITISVSTLYAS
jgi:hypothetical protein